VGNLQSNCRLELDRILEEPQLCFFTYAIFVGAEFWKTIPSTEPFRVVLGNVRDKLYQTRERMRQQLSSGKSDIPLDETFTDKSQVAIRDQDFSMLVTDTVEVLCFCKPFVCYGGIFA